MSYDEIVNKRTNTPLKLNIYDGFKDMNSLNFRLRRYTRLNSKNVVIVVFQGMYYALATDGLERAVIMGNQTVWYYKNHILHKTTWMYFEEPYRIKTLLKKISSKNQIARDLKELDPNLQVVAWWDNGYEVITNKKQSEHYLNILGRTFYEVYFNIDNYKEELLPYFETYTLGSYFKSGVAGINPFQNKVLMTNGRSLRTRFYT